MERDNRKSHLAPQLSPTTQDLLLRSNDSPSTHSDSAPAFTPTSGEIPIVGAVISPRDQAGHTQNRSPSRNGNSSLGRAAGSSIHPGLGQRSVTANSVPRARTPEVPLPTTLGSTFSLPVRPAPPGVPLPPPPPRKETPDESRREARRQATYGSSSNGGYASLGFASK